MEDAIARVLLRDSLKVTCSFCAKKCSRECTHTCDERAKVIISWDIPGREFCGQGARRRCIRRTRCRWSWCSASHRGGSPGLCSTASQPPASLAGSGPPLPPCKDGNHYSYAIVTITIIFPFKHQFHYDIIVILMNQDAPAAGNTHPTLLPHPPHRKYEQQWVCGNSHSLFE